MCGERYPDARKKISIPRAGIARIRPFRGPCVPFTRVQPLGGGCLRPASMATRKRQRASLADTSLRTLPLTAGTGWKPLAARPAGPRCAPRPRFARPAVLASSGPGRGGQPLPFPPEVVRSTERTHRASTVRSNLGTPSRAGLKGAGRSVGPRRRKDRRAPLAPEDRSEPRATERPGAFNRVPSLFAESLVEYETIDSHARSHDRQNQPRTVRRVTPAVPAVPRRPAPRSRSPGRPRPPRRC